MSVITKSASLYFIAIVPNEEIRNSIHAFKQDVADRFGSKAALKSPPHITLHMPFRLSDKKIPDLEKVLTEVSECTSPFDVLLQNFDCFPPRVIFVGLPENPELKALQHRLLKSMRLLNLFNGNYKDRPFHPHITIGFRDLKPAAFKIAWNEYKEREITLNFIASHLSLLKHNGNTWEVFKEFSFGTNLDKAER